MPPKFEYPQKFAHSPEDVPAGEHFAILCSKSIYIPGDERSRTNPGHGYPASTEQTWDYEVYANREKWEQAIEYKTLRGDKFVPLHANRPVVEKKVTVSVTVTPK